MWKVKLLKQMNSIQSNETEKIVCCSGISVIADFTILPFSKTTSFHAAFLIIHVVLRHRYSDAAVPQVCQCTMKELTYMRLHQTHPSEAQRNVHGLKSSNDDTSEKIRITRNLIDSSEHTLAEWDCSCAQADGDRDWWNIVAYVAPIQDDFHISTSVRLTVHLQCLTDKVLQVPWRFFFWTGFFHSVLFGYKIAWDLTVSIPPSAILQALFF